MLKFGGSLTFFSQALIIIFTLNRLDDTISIERFFKPAKDSRLVNLILMYFKQEPFAFTLILTYDNSDQMLSSAIVLLFKLFGNF